MAGRPDRTGPGGGGRTGLGAAPWRGRALSERARPGPAGRAGGRGGAAGRRGRLSRRRRRPALDLHLHPVRVDPGHDAAAIRRGFVGGRARRLPLLPAAGARGPRERPGGVRHPGVGDLRPHDPEPLLRLVACRQRAIARERRRCRVLPGHRQHSLGPALRGLVRLRASRLAGTSGRHIRRRRGGRGPLSHFRSRSGDCDTTRPGRSAPGR